MKEQILINTLDNAWNALSEYYVDSPDESTRIAMNKLSQIINKVKKDLFDIEKAENKARQAIELQEWREYMKGWA